MNAIVAAAVSRLGSNKYTDNGVQNMASGDTILATKYNSIKTKVDRIITAGSGAEGYGGSSTTTAVKGPSAGTSPSDLITELQWDNLRNDITKCYRHQNGLSPTITDVYQGLTIYWAHAVQYDVLADGIITNKDTIYTGATTGSYTQQASLITGTGSTQTGNWKTSATCTFTINLGTQENARLFFNLGGQISLVLSHTAGGAAGTKSAYWAAVIDQIIAAKPTITASNYRNQTGFSGTYDVTSVPYTDNAASVTMQWTTNPPVGILVTVTLNDASGQPNAPWGTDENAGIDITANYELRCSVGEFTGPVPTQYAAPAWSSS
jgi:hypothetical protein